MHLFTSTNNPFFLCHILNQRKHINGRKSSINGFVLLPYVKYTAQCSDGECSKMQKDAFFDRGKVFFF